MGIFIKPIDSLTKSKNNTTNLTLNYQGYKIELSKYTANNCM